MKLQVRQGNTARTLDGPFSLVASFETLRHVSEQLAAALVVMGQGGAEPCEACQVDIYPEPGTGSGLWAVKGWEE